MSKQSNLNNQPVGWALFRVSAPMSIGIFGVLMVGLSDAFFLMDPRTAFHNRAFHNLDRAHRIERLLPPQSLHASLLALYQLHCRVHLSFLLAFLSALKML